MTNPLRHLPAGCLVGSPPGSNLDNLMILTILMILIKFHSDLNRRIGATLLRSVGVCYNESHNRQSCGEGGNLRHNIDMALKKKTESDPIMSEPWSETWSEAMRDLKRTELVTYIHTYIHTYTYINKYIINLRPDSAQACQISKGPILSLLTSSSSWELRSWGAKVHYEY